MNPGINQPQDNISLDRPRHKPSAMPRSRPRSRSRRRSASPRGRFGSSRSRREEYARRKPRGDSVQPTRLIVANLTRNVNEKHLSEIFAHYGKVDGVRIRYDATSRVPTGTAFVFMTAEEGARSACRYMDGGQIDGNRIKVQYESVSRARSQRARAPRRPYRSRAQRHRRTRSRSPVAPGARRRSRSYSRTRRRRRSRSRTRSRSRSSSWSSSSSSPRRSRSRSRDRRRRRRRLSSPSSSSDESSSS